MNTSKSAIVISTIIGKVCSIIGYILVVTLGLPLVMGAFKNTDIGVYIFVSIIILLGVLLILFGIKTKRRIKRFKRYVLLISNEHMISLQNLATTTSQSIDFIKKDLQKMINKKYFTNASIDLGTGVIVIGNRQQIVPNINTTTQENIPIEIETITCSGCGATNSRQKGIVGYCEYCGTILK